VLSNFLGNLSLWLYLPKYIKKVNLKDINITRHIKPTIMLFIPQIATQIYTVLDKTMIGTIIADKSEVGYYEQAQKIIKLLMTIATSLGTVMMPRIASTYASGDIKKVRKYMNKSFAFIMMLAFPLMFGIISVASSFVPLFFGSGYDKVIPLLCIISPIIVLIGLSNVVGTQYLLPTKKQNKYTLSVVVGAIVNFVLNLILIPKLASIGASIATVIAELSVTATQFLLIRKEIRITDVLTISYKYIICSIIMFLCSMFIGILISNNLLSIIVQVVFSVIIYFGLLYILRDEMILEGIRIVKSKTLK
jgi:O-antigen/teichoic acid export membrane protein